jgi:heme exporter protein C
MMRERWTTACALLAAPALALCQWLVFVYAPVERSMGFAQKIFYLHLPLAWWGLASFFVVFAASIAYLRSRRLCWDHLARAGAEVGLMLATLALISGSIWARHSWGVWWTWDPRLTTTLIMCFVYAAYLALRGLELPPQRKRAICAVVGIAAFLDVPLVFVSARLWRSIHPAVFASEGGGLEPEMRLTALACVMSFGLLWLAFTALRVRQLAAAERIEHLLMSRHEQDA